MKRVFVWIICFLALIDISAQSQKEQLKDCCLEKDRIFVDWENGINKKYADRKSVERFTQKRLRQFYCENLFAKDRLENGEYVVSKGRLTVVAEDENYLLFTLKMDDIVYTQKLYIHVGPGRKLLVN